MFTEQLKEIIQEQIKKAVKDEFQDIIQHQKMSKALIKSIKYCGKVFDNACITSDDVVEAVETMPLESISANLTVEELRCNLDSLFRLCIITEDVNEADRIKELICIKYREYVASSVTLRHVDNDVHTVGNKVDAVNKNVDGLHEKLDESNDTSDMILCMIQNPTFRDVTYMNVGFGSNVYKFLVYKCENLSNDYTSLPEKSKIEEVLDEYDILNGFGEEVMIMQISAKQVYIGLNFETALPYSKICEVMEIMNKYLEGIHYGVLSISTNS